jgi:two-component system chemotaxis response regulator CheY
MSYNFLVVHASATTRAHIKRTIRSSGMPVGILHDASDGDEALDALASHRVDLILADVAMPGGDGAEMIGRFLSEPATRAIPVLVLWAKPDPRTLRRLRRAGARGWLPLPFTPQALHHAMSRVLEPTHV